MCIRDSYHRFKNPLFTEVLEHLLRTDAQVVLLPRTPEQAFEFGTASGITVPERAVDGPSLVYAADVVVSAGGTMNREAALLGTPTWTTFRGELGAVDRSLIETGRMRILERPEQLHVVKHTPTPPDYESLADEVTAEILRR